MTFAPGKSIVAAIQFSPELMQPERNLTTALQLTFEAAAKGARVIVLPELCTSGYALRSVKEATRCAQDRNGYITEAFAAIARQFGCHVVFGYVELMEGKLYNSAAVVGPSGMLEGNAQKHNLYGSDNLWAQPSEAPHPVVMTAAGRLGILVCRDATNRFRESYAFNNGSKFYNVGSVDTIALLTNWGESFGYPDSSWVELAEETRANVIVSNRVGVERDMTWKGGSCVIDRNRRIYTNGSSFTEAAVVGGVVVCE